jgi:NADPH-dependent 2,4-dienoyl-CoA reductase/sulfur reductase-like enzyme
MEHLVIVGAGLAGLRVAEGARSVDPVLAITLIGDEPCAPYSRPPLSKAFVQDRWPHDKLLVRPLRWYDEARVSLRIGCAVTRIELEARKVLLNDGQSLSYDRLVLATGSRPRRLVGPDIDASCVEVLRTAADARHIREKLHRPGALLVVGGGVIGLELAASARKLGCRVTVLEAGARLMARSVPPEASARVEQLHAGQGVEILFGIQISSIQRSGDAVRVTTNSGVFLADVVVAGIGVAPNTEMAMSAGLRVEDGIVVDQFGRTDREGVFAAGEVTRHFNPALNDSLRVESWQIADRQALAVGKTAAGLPTAYEEVPWFWSDQYETNLQVLGSFAHVTEVIERPGSTPGSTTLMGLDGGQRLAAAVCINAGRDMLLLKRIVATRASVETQALGDPSVSLRDVLTECQALVAT